MTLPTARHQTLLGSTCFYVRIHRRVCAPPRCTSSLAEGRDPRRARLSSDGVKSSTTFNRPMTQVSTFDDAPQNLTGTNKTPLKPSEMLRTAALCALAVSAAAFAPTMPLAVSSSCGNNVLPLASSSRASARAVAPKVTPKIWHPRCSFVPRACPRQCSSRRAPGIVCDHVLITHLAS